MDEEFEIIEGYEEGGFYHTLYNNVETLTDAWAEHVRRMMGGEDTPEKRLATKTAILDELVTGLKGKQSLKPNDFNHIHNVSPKLETASRQLFEDTLKDYFLHLENKFNPNSLSSFYTLWALHGPGDDRPLEEYLQHTAILLGARNFNLSQDLHMAFPYFAHYMRWTDPWEHAEGMDLSELQDFMDKKIKVNPIKRQRAAFTIQKGLMEARYRPGGIGYLIAKRRFENMAESMSAKRARKK